MASSSLIRNAALQDLYVCARCSFRATRLSRQPQRRWIGMKYLAKQANAENAWQAKAQEINDGTKQSMLSILEERGLVHQIAGYDSPHP
jgi:tyrosyl-tRNA synthetase